MEENRDALAEDRSNRDLASEDTGGNADVWQPDESPAPGGTANDPYGDTTMSSGRGQAADETVDRSDQASATDVETPSD